MKPVRTFVAIELSPEIAGRTKDLVAHLRRVVADIRWVAPENMHLTLKFLGDVDLLEVAKVCGAVSKAVAEVRPFEIEVGGAGAFPDLVRPRTIWIGVREGDEQLVELHRRVEESLVPLGFRKEGRRFRPHMTLGRVRDSAPDSRFAEVLLSRADYQCGRMMVSDVAVFSSELTRDGPVYEVLGRADFGGR